MNFDGDQSRAISLAAIMVLSVVAVGGAFAGNVAAQESGADIIVGGSDNADYSTVQAAIDAASDDSVIVIESGTYNDPVEFDSSLSNITLQANDSANPPELTAGIKVSADVSDLTLKDLQLSGDAGAGRTLNLGGGSLSNVTIDRVTFEGGSSLGAAIYGNSFAGNITITDTTVSNYTAANDWSLVYLGSTGIENVVTTGSTVQNSVGMVAFGEINNSVTIKDNTFTGIESDSDGSATAALALGNPAFTDTTVASISDNTFSDNFNHVVLGDVNGETVKSVVDSNDFDLAAYDDMLISPSVQNAVGSADSGDTVSVKSGTYEESVTIDTENVTLRAADGANATLAFKPDSKTGAPTVKVTADDSAVRGFHIVRTAGGDRSTSSSPVAQGVRVSGSNVTIANDTVRGVGMTDPESKGIMVFDDESSDKTGESVSNVTIADNDVTGFYGGLSVVAAYGGSIDGVKVTDTVVNGTDYGMTVGEVDGTVSNLAVHYNDFENVTTGIAALDGKYRSYDVSAPAESINATLNYWGSSQGPAGDGANVTDGVNYDPFLTVSPSEVTPGEVQDFGNDLTLRGNTTYAIATPAPLTTGKSLKEFFNSEFDGTVYGWNTQTQQWVPGDELSGDVGALSAFVVTPDEDVSITFTYANSTQQTSLSSKQVSAGWNFVGASQYGDAETAFSASAADPARLIKLYEQPESQPYGTGAAGVQKVTFGGSDTVAVSPYTGYWVYTNQDGTIAANTGAGVTASQFEQMVEA